MMGGWLKLCARQERMDAAITRAIIRVVAVAISGTLGFGVMYKLDVATNPYALTAILAVWAGLLGGRTACHLHLKGIAV